jgi:GTPase SAR1 family protein|tara:strand:+ start:117 stop:614 length:498 start_codon:yes stop_codon:yes gene_type:complete
MYNVTIVGHQRVGKSTLVHQWRGHEFSESYYANIFVEKTEFPTMVVSEIPGISRFINNVDHIYANTDVFVIVVREDTNMWSLYDELSLKYKDASWLLVTNGDDEFPNCRLYVQNRDMYMTHVNLKTGAGVTNSLGVLWELTRLHPKRSIPVSLVGEVYQMFPTCL